MRFEQAPFYVGVVTVALSVGYFAGSRSSKLRDQIEPVPTKIKEELSREDEASDSESEISSVAGDQDLSSVELLPEDECKLVLVVRSDLGMSTGKIAAQHATLACYKTLLASNIPVLRRWEKSGQTKVALRCSNEEELLTLQAQAQSLNLCARSIQDAGRTQIAAGSRTVLGILGPVRLVNRITGTLRLL
ncbi:peptidyl-trna hydrolase 2 [Moniliophthora roreri MCA 2997]|uniref:peptidyl-tRNA hydrolase n=1 Tax=Moniliophthora roreri (strain MCA 2997) TaxID=1381753 RepID=V2Z3A1_MONRO|nr:peptidyl-trna hydrolase 2 [Moniliophthora roreri MCA 2997]